MLSYGTSFSEKAGVQFGKACLVETAYAAGIVADELCVHKRRRSQWDSRVTQQVKLLIERVLQGLLKKFSVSLDHGHRSPLHLQVHMTRLLDTATNSSMISTCFAML